MERQAPKSPSEKIAAEEAPKRPAGKKKKKRENPFFAFINGALSFAVIMVVVVLAGVYFFIQRFQEPSQLAEEQVILIPSGSSLNTIANQLADVGAVENSWLFRMGVKMNGKAGALKAGEYAIPPQASMADIMNKLVEGKSIMHKVTLPEGLTSEQIVARLREHDVLLGEIAEIPAEGTLLPETYTFMRGTTRADIIRQMQRAQRQALERIWANRAPDLPVKTPEELVILASIVEKETGVAEERPQVAGVFVNRLNQGIKLQSDPTIIYGLVGGKGSLGRGIRKSEITSDTPYNTYVIDGLPIGPIANPGLKALEATANPDKHDYIFFVADGTGGHAFATTLEEHNANVAKWRQIEAQRGQAQQQPATNTQ